QDEESAHFSLISDRKNCVLASTPFALLRRNLRRSALARRALDLSPRTAVFEITCAVVYAKVRRADDDTPDVFRNVMTKTQTDSKKLSYGRHLWIRARECEWLRSEAKRRGVMISALIREALVQIGLPTKAPSLHRRSTAAMPSSHRTAPAGCVHRWARVAHGRTRMIVFPLIRLVGLKAATASSRVETLPMFVRSRPSRTRRTISLSWARSDSTTKSTARPSAGRASGGPTMDTSVPPARVRPADRFPMSPPMTSNTRSTLATSSRTSFSRSTNSCAPKSSTV